VIAIPAIRPLRAADIRTLAGVLARAYAAPQNFELRLHSYLDMNAVATFVAELGGAPVGMVVGNDYGPTAYVSQMAVDPPLQRRGIATALMAGLLAWADGRGFDAVELDATAAGAPLYARNGFAACGETVVYHSVWHAGRAPGARPATAGDRERLYAVDRNAFGADRIAVLRLLVDAAHNAVVVVGPPGQVVGYAIAQADADVLGPVVAPDAAAAGALIDAARAHLPALHRAMLPSANAAAQAIFTARGYHAVRSTTHMIRGVCPPARRERLFARINLGQG
jgi:GNAT superfamily N-acetyltransferase